MVYWMKWAQTICEGLVDQSGHGALRVGEESAGGEWGWAKSENAVNALVEALSTSGNT